MNKDLCDVCGKGPIYFTSMTSKTIMKKRLLGGFLQREAHEEHVHEVTEKKLCESCHMKNKPAETSA